MSESNTLRCWTFCSTEVLQSLSGHSEQHFWLDRLTIPQGRRSLKGKLNVPGSSRSSRLNPKGKAGKAYPFSLYRQIPSNAYSLTDDPGKIKTSRFITRESFQFLTFWTPKSLELLAPNEAGRVCPPVLYGSLTLKVAKVNILFFSTNCWILAGFVRRWHSYLKSVIFFQVSNPGPGLWRMVRLVSLFLPSGVRGSTGPSLSRFVIECIFFFTSEAKNTQKSVFCLFCTHDLLHSIPCFFSDSSSLSDRASIVPRDDLLWFLQFPTFLNVGTLATNAVYRVKMDQKRQPTGLACRLDIR